MEIQCRALAEAMALDYSIRTIRPSRLLRLLPICGRIPGLPPGATGSDRLNPPYPAIVITCGRRHAGASIAIRRASGRRIFTVHIQDPRIAPGMFDVLVVPEHDRVRGPNVITTVGSLHRISEDSLAREAARFANHIAILPRPRVTVNIGGGTRQHKVTTSEAERLAGTLAELRERHGCSLLITTSRRTDPALQAALAQLDRPADTILWGGNGANPYLGFLGLADAIVVTSESINMVSEACATGKPVYLLSLGVTTRRRAAFVDTVITRGLAHPFDGTLDARGGPPLRDMAKVARQVYDRFAGHGVTRQC